MVVYKIRLLQETLKFHILADNFPGEDVDFRANVIRVVVRIARNDLFVPDNKKAVIAVSLGV